MWKDLSLKEKAEIMRMSVANGVTDINDIKAIYDNEANKYQLGGYKQWKNAIAKYKHLDIDNDPTYDYEGFYNSDPLRAWGLLNEEPNAHFVDNFKTAQHPTFSKESNYSGKVHPIYNPQGIEGGTWGNKSFTLSKDWQKGPSLQDRISYLEDAEDEGVTLYGPNGELPIIYSNDVWGGVLPNVDIYSKALGGHLYNNAGPLAKKKPYDYGDPNEITRIIADHELFRSSPYEDGPERGWYSVGFGTNNHGGAGQDANMRRILGYGWKELHAGRKMTREEAMKLMLYDINNNIKPLLRRTLGDKLYSELPGNFLNTFIDMGYQSPARMVKAARAYKTSGPDAAIKAMMMGKAKKQGGGTYDLTQRNNQRRAMWGASSDTKAGDVPDVDYNLESMPSTGGGYSPQLLSQAAFQPIVIGGNQAEQSNPWMEYLARVNQPAMLNTPIGQTTAPQSVAQNISMPSLFEPINFSGLQTNTNAQAAVDPYVAKQVIEEGLGLENNALWNSPYLMFDNHLAANGGHLFDTAGQMLIRNDAVNPALQYVYGPDYERIVRESRNYRPTIRAQRPKPRYNIEQRADVVGNTVRPVEHKIRTNQQAESPARRQEEQRKADAAREEYRKARQGVISQAPDRMRHPDYNREFANEVQALREQETEENRKAALRRAVEHNIAEGMEAIPWPSTIAGAYFNPSTHWYDPGSFFSNLYANDNRGFFNFNQATRDFYDANPEVGGVANLIGDFIVPGAAAKILKGASRAGKFAAEIPYNTIGGQFGYYGDNILQRAYSTALRNSSLKNLDRGRPIEFIRKLDTPLELNSNGKITLSNQRFVKDGKPIDHINVSSDRQVASHKRGSWEDKPYVYIIKEKPIIEQANLKSIEPSDTFGYGSKVEVNPSDMTLVTGDVEEIRKAKKLGMDVMSSKKLRSLYKELEKIKYPNSNLTLKERAALPNPKNADVSKAYRIEMQNVMNRRGHPTVKDYSLLESKTGLNAGIVPIENAPNYLKFENDVRTAMHNGDPNIPVLKFPNGREVDINELLNTRHDPYRVPYYNVWYDPITHADAEFRLANNIVPRNNINAQLNVNGVYHMPSNVDFTSPFASNRDVLNQFLYGQALSGDGSAVYDYLSGVGDMTEGLSKEVQDYLLRNIIGRRIIAGEKEGYWTGNVQQATKEAMDKVRVREFSQEAFDKAGCGHNAGLFNEKNNFIAINKDDTKFGREYIETHEGDHLIDTIIPQTENQQSVINTALDDDFLDLPNKANAGSLKGYKHMDKERTTTIHDAVRRLLTKEQQKWDIHLQNKLIDKMSDEKIFGALEKANGYGRRFVEFLKENGKATPEKAQQIREAMKIGCITLVVGATTTNI